MSGRFFDCINWRRPWLSPFLPVAEPLLQAPDWRVELNAAASEMDLCNHRGLPIRFVPQESLPPQTAYEAFISATGNVPTRDNLHDFFNALVWLSFPKIKVQLNALQSAEIEKGGGRTLPNGSRGKTRDAATLFDENAALLVVRNTEWIEAFRAHRWQEIFIERRDTFQNECEVWLFGHALMEKLVNPYKGITAHAWPLVVEGTFFEMSVPEKRIWLDISGSKQLVNGLATPAFTPLPVLGVPEWWGRQDELFYADTSVFRPPRSRL